MKSKEVQLVERKLGRERLYGSADIDKRIIEIDPTQDPKDYLDTVIHEYLHILEPQWSEKKVTATAKKISKLLWRINYRKVLQ